LIHSFAKIVTNSWASWFRGGSYDSYSEGQINIFLTNLEDMGTSEMQILYLQEETAQHILIHEDQVTNFLLDNLIMGQTHYNEGERAHESNMGMTTSRGTASVTVETIFRAIFIDGFLRKPSIAHHQEEQRAQLRAIFIDGFLRKPSIAGHLCFLILAKHEILCGEEEMGKAEQFVVRMCPLTCLRLAHNKEQIARRAILKHFLIKYGLHM
ncbi:hypothetical protein ACJX0J_027463, partial [Zea mays]